MTGNNPTPTNPGQATAREAATVLSDREFGDALDLWYLLRRATPDVRDQVAALLAEQPGGGR